MTAFATADWPAPADLEASARARASAGSGLLAVWRFEVAKLSRLLRVHVVLAACVAAPFLAALAFAAQGAVPADTLFGQWVHQSGFATAMVVLGFSGQWALPFVVAVVAGDIFSAEDHFGTWKTLLTRSRSRRDVFLGKLFAALTYSVVALAFLGAASLAAAVLAGAHPVTALGGQLVPAGHAAVLVVQSWAVQLPPMLAFTALAVALSVLSRTSVVGIGAPVLLGLAGQLLTLIDLPTALRIALPTTPFQAWHGLWVDRPFHDPIVHGLWTSAAWFAASLGIAWLVFRRRSIRIAA